MDNIYDSIVIGAGPAGITAALYLKRAGLNICIIEKSAPGGQMNKTSIVENYPGVGKTTGPDLALNFFKQLQEENIEYKYGEVIKITDEGDIKIVETKEEIIKTKSIILALGREPKRLENKNSKDLEGRGVSFCSLCDGALYKNEEVSIVGGGNSALEEALYLSGICKKVYILNRGETLKGDNTLIDRVIKTKNIEVFYNSEVKDFIKEDNTLKYLSIIKDNKEQTLNVKACFIFIGYEPATKFLKNLDILDEMGYIIVGAGNMTRIKNIYAAGDIVKKEAYQIVTSASDGAIAAVSCIKNLK